MGKNVQTCRWKTAAVFMLTGAFLGSGVLWGYKGQNVVEIIDLRPDCRRS